MVKFAFTTVDRGDRMSANRSGSTRDKVGIADLNHGDRLQAGRQRARLERGLAAAERAGADRCRADLESHRSSVGHGFLGPGGHFGRGDPCLRGWDARGAARWRFRARGDGNALGLGRDLGFLAFLAPGPRRGDSVGASGGKLARNPRGIDPDRFDRLHPARHVDRRGQARSIGDRLSLDLHAGRAVAQVLCRGRNVRAEAAHILG